MAVFSYQASDHTGEMHKGRLTADTLDDAMGQIIDLNLVPIDLVRVGSSPGSVFSRLQTHYLPVPASDLIVFTKQLVTMVRVGIPMTQAFAILKDQTVQPRLRRLAGIIRDDIEAGSSLSAAAGRHSKVFSPLFCSMIEAGEASGTLPEVLDRLLYLIEHEAQVKAEIKTAMRYPFIVVGVLGVAFLVMVGFVIPRFVSFFDKQGLDLPLPTRMCITMSEILTGYGIWIALGTIVSGLLFHRYFNRTDPGRLIRDRSLLAIPLIGPVLVKAAMSRFASIFAILQSSGVLVLDSLRILTETVGNAAISAEFVKVRELLEEGHGIAGPLSSSSYFPPMLVNMVKIGEESGRLDEMLRHVSEHYDVEISYTIKKMTDAIGPLLIISLTVVVGFFALAIYMPMWELTQMTGKK
ncbi:MAG: type II secretion system F family protein [Akkermansiaceae bacterium]|nr:type II secretion system F family protein [Akkermansiaceae bacterium]